MSEFPFGKVPVFKTVDGRTIYESNAIAQYIASHKPELLGADDYEHALVQQYLNVANAEVGRPMSQWVYSLLGYLPYDKAAVKAAESEARKVLAILDKILLVRTYLVGDSITLADIVMACTVMPLYQHVLEAADRTKYINLTRWFVTCVNQPQFIESIGEVKLCTKALTEPCSAPACSASACSTSACTAAVPTPAPTPVATAAPAEATGEEEAPVEIKKPRNPLDLLPPTNFNLEDWKRFYSNNDTRPTAIDYFWKNFDPQGFSVWWVDYKYNDELTKIFMTCNLVGGLFARLGHMSKYSFGSFLIFGEDNKNEISGAIIFRGSEIPPEIKVVADYDSYAWRRANLEDPAERELFEDYLAWDGKLNGKVVNQGKTFK